jgi:protocatechuate 3,4-dioxygenase beta subunit
MTRAINRRTALTLFGGAGLGAVGLGACSKDEPAGTASGTQSQAPSAGSSAAAAGGGTVTAAMFGDAAACTLTPEQTEGPYYIDVDKIRADIREDRAGTPLRVAARVMGSDGCSPIKDAIFEIWHCDAGGLYSGFEAASQGGGGGGGGSTDDQRYLRGAQTTNADGIAVITTIYPGWYSGRTVHIHAKIALSNTELLTTQLYFDESTTKQVYAAAPYSANPGPDTTNADDGIYRSETTLTLTKDGDGYLGLITIGVAK